MQTRSPGRSIIGGLVGAASGAALAYGITSTVVSATDCALATCASDVTTGLPLLIGGTLGLMVSVFLWWGSWIVAPVVGLLVAGGVLIADGRDIPLGPAAFIVASVLVGPAILVAIAVASRRKQKLAADLFATGQKAVAHIQGVQETGVFINHRPQVAVDYLLHPLSGAPPFPTRKTQTLAYGAPQPRPGLAWPAWYDPADPGKVAIGAPTGAAVDPGTEEIYRQFGLTLTQVYGYDPRAAQQGFGQPSAAAAPPGPPITGGQPPQGWSTG